MVNTSGSYPHKIIKGLEMQKKIGGGGGYLFLQIMDSFTL